MTFPIDEIAMDLRCDARKKCNRKAVFIVSIHNINDCKSWLANVPGAVRLVSGRGLSTGGDTVWLMCLADLAVVAKRLDAMVGETCVTCGRRINQVGDVMTVEDLR